MIWQFGELGYDVSIEENGRTGRKPVKWGYYDDANRRGLYDTYCKLIALRTSAPQLFDATSTFVWKVTESDWDKGRTLSLRTHDGKGLVVVTNFTAAEITCTPTFPSTGAWYDYMGDGGSLNIEAAERAIKLPANSYRVYTNFP
jgi:hypothetical protein